MRDTHIPLHLSNLSLSTYLPNAAPEELSVDAKITLLFSGFIPQGTAIEGIKALQRGLNQMNKNQIAVDGIWGPKSEAALEAAGYSAPLIEADYNQITAQVPAEQHESVADKKNDATLKSAADHKMSWVPFGVNFKRNTTTQKTLVWGIWLILAMLLTFGLIDLFEEKKGAKHTHA